MKRIKRKKNDLHEMDIKKTKITKTTTETALPRMTLLPVPFGIFTNEIYSKLQNADSYFKLGCDRLGLKAYEQSLECFNSILKDEPDCYFFLNNKGVVLYQLQRYSEAVKMFEAASSTKKFHPTETDMDMAKINMKKALQMLQRKEEHKAVPKEKFPETVSFTLPPLEKKDSKENEEITMSRLESEIICRNGIVALPDMSLDSKVWPNLQTILHPPFTGVKIDEDYLCPITNLLIYDPPVCITGYGETYEEEAIRNYLTQSNISPITKEPLQNTQLSINEFAKKQIRRFIDSNPILKDSEEWYLPFRLIARLEAACNTGDEKTIRELANLDRRLLVHTFKTPPCVGKTALHLAASGHLMALDTIIELLETRQQGLALAALLRPDPEGFLPFHRAVQAKQNVQILVELAMRMGKQLSAIEKLPISWPGDVDNPSLNEALAWSIDHEKFEESFSLIHLGAKPTTITGKQGRTLLHLAAMSNRKELVLQLMKKDASLLRQPDAEGNTALHSAAAAGAAEVVIILLKEGIVENFRNKSGKTARELLLDSNQHDTVKRYDKVVGELYVAEEKALKGAGFLGMFLLKQQLIIRNQQQQLDAYPVEIKAQQQKIQALEQTLQQRILDFKTQEIEPLSTWKVNFFTQNLENKLIVMRQKAEEEDKLRVKLVQACEQGDVKLVRQTMQEGAKPFYSDLDAKQKQPFSSAVWGMNPEVLNELINKAGGVAPMTWEECKKYNLDIYGETFIVDKFAPQTFQEWDTLLKKIAPSLFLCNYHLKMAHNVWHDSDTSSWENLCEFVKNSSQRERMEIEMFHEQILVEKDGIRASTEKGYVEFRAHIQRKVEATSRRTLEKTL